MFAGAFMMGAKDRLLPPSVPFRFFATAVLFHVAAWGALVVGADDLPGYMGGLGAALAGLHLVTLGVLAMSAMGAAFQMLPVATRRQLGPVWACRLTWWLFAPGVAVLSVGLGTGWVPLLHGGGALVVAGLGLFGWLVLSNIRQVGDLPVVTRHVWIALASLVMLLLLAVLLLADTSSGLLPDRGRVAAAHAVVAGYGFMGNLVLGFSHVLVPMFVLAQGGDDRLGRSSAALAALGLVLALIGILGAWPLVTAAAGLCGLLAVGVHLRVMYAILATRMRKLLEPFFRLIYLAWAVLPLSLILGIGAALGVGPEISLPIWGWLLIFGWLLTFVTGILQRIMPFLASMHSGSGGGKPILLSRLVAARPLDSHLMCHGIALGLVTAGMIGQWDLLVRIGCVFGLLGAVSFALFAFEMMRRYRRHERQH